MPSMQNQPRRAVHRPSPRFGHALVGFALAGAPLLGVRSELAAQGGAPEGWVGCWRLDHVEDWAPTVPQPGFPSGSTAPAPRLLLLDRLPGLRSSLPGAEGARTWRAEWAGTALRGTEVWAQRGDGHVLVQHVGGIQVITLLVEGPPVDGAAPARWFFLRTDSALPEIRSLVTARRTTCPEGREPHAQVEAAAVRDLLQGAGVQGIFVHYDGSARRITRGGTVPDRGLPLGSEPTPTSAWNQVARLVDEASRAGEEPLRREEGSDRGAGRAWIAGRTRGPEGRVRAWALHLHETPPGWLDGEGRVEALLEDLLMAVGQGRSTPDSSVLTPR